MLHQKKVFPLVVAFVCVLLQTLNRTAAQPPAPEERVAALKQQLQVSREQLRQYEWIETTVISYKGDEKSRRQHRCYYGADDKLQKILLSGDTPGKTPGGLRGRIVKKKKEDLSEYMERAVDLIKMYVPPDPALIQRSRDSGGASLHMTDPGKRARLEFRDYLQAGDTVAVEMDLMSNQILGLQVSTYLDTPEDVVGLDVYFAALNDGSTYAAKVNLSAKAKHVTVAVENAGYRKM